MSVQNPYIRKGLPASKPGGGQAGHAVSAWAGKASIQPCGLVEPLPLFWWQCSVWCSCYIMEKILYAGNRGLATSGWTAVIGAGRNKGEGTGGNGLQGRVEAVRTGMAALTEKRI